MIAPDGRRGLTLIELLVVVGLLVSLFALVANGVGRPSVGALVRRSAQDLASRLLAVQSRALGKPEGASLIVSPDASNARLGTMVFDAVAQPLFTGSASGLPPSPPLVTSATVAITADPQVLAAAYKIRFQPTANGAQVSPGPSPWFAYTSGTVRYRDFAGQTLANTIWPKTPSQAEQAVIAVYPSPGNYGSAMDKQVAIDLRHSGVGEDPAAPHGYGRFEGAGSIAVAYEQVGRVAEVMRRVMEPRTSADQPIPSNSVIYFLFASREDILAGRNTLANPQSIWVAINPHTGRATVAENVPQSAEDKTALTSARQNARAGTTIK